MASSKGGDDEQSQMFAIFCVHMCTHVHAWFQIKYVTRNKSYAKGISMVVTTTWQFHLKSKVRLELSRWPQTQSPVHWSKYKRCDGRPTSNKHIVRFKSDCSCFFAFARTKAKKQRSQIWIGLVSTRPSHSLCSQGVPIAAVMSVTYWCVSKLRFVQVNLHANQYWVNSEATK